MRGPVRNRREILKGMAGGLAVPAFASLLPLNKALGQAPSAGIDAHCHVFNASDLPVASFLQRVIFENYERAVVPEAFGIPNPFAGLAVALIKFLKNGVIEADVELARLKAGTESFVAAGYDPFSLDAQKVLDKVLEEVLSPGAESFREFPLSDYDRAAFESALEMEMSAQSGGVESEFIVGRAARLLAGQGFISRHFRWAAWLRSPRMHLAHEINRMYGGRSRIQLFTPALIDYTRWLDDEEPVSNVASQIAVMEAVQKNAIGNFGFMLHSLAPYDPWRQVTDLAEGRKRLAEDKPKVPTALELVQDAVEQRGFLGVKLYPPMGFLPANNRHHRLKYPERADAIEEFQAKIDAALESLYAWAAENGVAILSHATNSNGAGEGFSERAHPKGWSAVLEQHPELRLNLAHFGHFDDPSWEFENGALIKKYPNVYADVSYLSTALGSRISSLHATADNLQDFFKRFDPGAERIVYGSDWVMLGLEADHERYFDATQYLMAMAGVSGSRWNNVVGRNAAKMYGLGAGEPARKRLEEWYRKSDLDPAMLERFD